MGKFKQSLQRFDSSYCSFLLEKWPPIIFSVNTFLMRKQKAYIYYIYFEIAVFLKTGVYIVYIIVYIYFIYIYNQIVS